MISRGPVVGVEGGKAELWECVQQIRSGGIGGVRRVWGSGVTGGRLGWSVENGWSGPVWVQLGVFGAVGASVGPKNFRIFFLVL